MGKLIAGYFCQQSVASPYFQHVLMLVDMPVDFILMLHLNLQMRLCVRLSYILHGSLYITTINASNNNIPTTHPEKPLYIIYLYILKKLRYKVRRIDALQTHFRGLENLPPKIKVRRIVRRNVRRTQITIIWPAFGRVSIGAWILEFT